ncbi:MAG: cobalamin biosynthesis protein CbiM [Spirochaetae bacterium HGW-Spirochaetae-5]|nr:MAG: cobalamin biosynthesis protein CbiM [Spirochaetae bacterium HGW-Spirochaetae-5]
MKNLKFAVLFFLLPSNLFSMHIMEGFLPPLWAGFWWLAALPFIWLGIVSVKKIVTAKPELKPLIAMAGAFAFVLSALKIPSVTGSSSHMTGVALGTLLFGPFTMALLGFIVLLFQALLLAHGGLTTLGANTISMAVAGPMMAYSVFTLCRKSGVNDRIGIFSAAFLCDIFTYVVTSAQLALAHPAADGGAAVSLVKFLTVFAVTQIPLAVIEGLLTVVVFNILSSYAIDEMKVLGFMKLTLEEQYEK